MRHWMDYSIKVIQLLPCLGVVTAETELYTIEVQNFPHHHDPIQAKLLLYFVYNRRAALH